MDMNVGMNSTGAVGARLRISSEVLNLSSRHVARLADIGMTNYFRLEHGGANPAITILLKIARALETSVEGILDGLTTRTLPDDSRAPFGSEEVSTRIARLRDGNSR